MSSASVLATVCLLGSGENISVFIKDIGMDFSFYDFCFYKDSKDEDFIYKFCDLRGHECFENTFNACVKEADAIICFDVNKAVVNSYKSVAQRDCQFITFDPHHMTPKEYLQFIRFQPDEKLISSVATKVMLLSDATYSENSIFNRSVVPIEVTRKIAKDLIDSSFGNNRVSCAFFISSFNTRNQSKISNSEHTENSEEAGNRLA